MIKKLNNSDMNNNGLLDIFKGKLKDYIRQYGSSFSSSVEQVEMASLMAFMLIQQYHGNISCEDLANRIESTLQGIIDQNDAERIATYVFDQYALMNKESIVNNVIPTSPVHTQVKIVQKPVQIDEETFWLSCNSIDSYNEYIRLFPQGVHYQKAITERNKLKAKEIEDQKESERQAAVKRKEEAKKQKELDEKEQSKVGRWVLAGPIVSGCSLCYLWELRWGYAILIILGLLLMAGMSISIIDEIKNRKVRNNVYRYLNLSVIVIFSTWALAVLFGGDEARYKEACEVGTLEAYQEFINKHPFSEYVDDAKGKQKEYEYYAVNRLEHGAKPYSSYYGTNPSYGSSTIRVIAPKESDVVVIIKDVNSDSKVKAHAYLRAGQSYSFYLSNGTYQTFFYYGTGWNPKKQQGDVKGAFVNDEIFSKDNPVDLDHDILTYTLQMTPRGNFRPKTSSRGEIF